MFILYHVFFGCTLGGVPWVYAAEVNSLGWRTRGAAAATGTNWLMAFVVVQFTKVGINNLGWAFFLSKQTHSFIPFPVFSSCGVWYAGSTLVVPELTCRVPYVVFAIISFSFAPIIFCFYPETSRRTLEDMDLIFIRNPGVFVFGKDELTKRERPQALIDAERERIAQSEMPPMGMI